jgi:hypothetical protein
MVIAVDQDLAPRPPNRLRRKIVTRESGRQRI